MQPCLRGGPNRTIDNYDTSRPTVEQARLARLKPSAGHPAFRKTDDFRAFFGDIVKLGWPQPLAPHVKIEQVEPVVARGDIMKTLRLDAAAQIQLREGNPLRRPRLAHHDPGRIDKEAFGHRRGFQNT